MTAQTKKPRQALTRWFTRKPEQQKQSRRRWYEVENCGVH
jgi:hypothetical protein